MKHPQQKRAFKMVELMKDIERKGKSVEQNRKFIRTEIEKEFDWCHDCLLLAVYGFFKNGYIKNTRRKRSKDIDFTGFNGSYSINIQHAFDALALLKKYPEMTTSDVKGELGGETSIYTFVRYFYENNLLNLD